MSGPRKSPLDAIDAVGVEPYFRDDAVVIYHADCRDILPKMPKVDLVLTDPPYGIGLNANFTRITDSNKGVSGYGRLRKRHPPIMGDDEPFDPTPLLRYPEAIIFGAQAISFPSGSLLVWDKRAKNGHALLSDGEVAWWSRGNGVRIFSHCWHGFARASENSEHYHPTQKPVALMKWCLSLVPDAQTILDPFMGSGTTLRAAKDLGRYAIGIETEEKYCEIAAKRMEQGVLL